jgi:hypothetical protein
MITFVDLDRFSSNFIKISRKIVLITSPDIIRRSITSTKKEKSRAKTEPLFCPPLCVTRIFRATKKEIPPFQPEGGWLDR